jgi:hypothetical protein
LFLTQKVQNGCVLLASHLPLDHCVDVRITDMPGVKTGQSSMWSGKEPVLEKESSKLPGVRSPEAQQSLAS